MHIRGWTFQRHPEDDRVALVRSRGTEVGCTVDHLKFRDPEVCLIIATEYVATRLNNVVPRSR